ncbi:SCO2584 family spore wall biosynthesis protein [Streptomyces sp. NPDC001070]
MPDELGGKPFPDGEDHGGADDEFASVVFDEAFIRAAAFHEPSAHERMLASATAQAEAEASRARVLGGEDGTGPYDEEDAAGRSTEDEEYEDLYAQRRPYRGHDRWHRTVAWVLAVVMGIGVVALTFAAVYRGAGGARQPAVPPAPTGRIGAPSLPPVAVSHTP